MTILYNLKQKRVGIPPLGGRRMCDNIIVDVRYIGCAMGGGSQDRVQERDLVVC